MKKEEEEEEEENIGHRTSIAPELNDYSDICWN